MKKTGFTLVEVLIALAVVGIVAAITIPTITNLIPDRNKVTVLKYYKIINDIHNDIKADPELWELSTDPNNQNGWNLHPNLASQNGNSPYANYFF